MQYTRSKNEEGQDNNETMPIRCSTHELDRHTNTPANSTNFSGTPYSLERKSYRCCKTPNKHFHTSKHALTRATYASQKGLPRCGARLSCQEFLQHSIQATRHLPQSPILLPTQVLDDGMIRTCWFNVGLVVDNDQEVPDIRIIFQVSS